MSEITIALPKFYPAQAELHRKKKRNNLLVLSRRWGKTTFSSRLVLHGSVTKEKYRAAWSAPTWKLMLDTFETHRRILEPVTRRVTREDRRIELINDAVVEYWSSDDPSAGRGRKYHIWVADESQRQRNLNAFMRGSVRPCLADYRGELWVLGTANGEGSDFHEYYLDCSLDPEHWFVAHGSLDQNPYIDPEEIAMMRRDLGPDLAAQELDSLWVRVDGVAPLVRQTEWIALYEEKQNTTQTRILALDGSVSDDTTALVGVWFDRDTEHYYVDYSDIVHIQPEVDTGEVDFDKLEKLILARWQTGKYSLLAYDPYQTVSLIQRIKKFGVRTLEFTQNSMRLKADSFLRQLINEGRIHHPDHELLTQHMLDTTLKYVSNTDGMSNQVRLVKARKDAKIDLSVALSMACWAHHSAGSRGAQVFQPMLSHQGGNRLPQPSVPSRTLSQQFSADQFLGKLLEKKPWTNS